MRTLVAAVLAIGIGLVGTTGVSALPVNDLAIDDAVSKPLVVKTSYYPYRRHYAYYHRHYYYHRNYYYHRHPYYHRYYSYRHHYYYPHRHCWWGPYGRRCRWW